MFMLPPFALQQVAEPTPLPLYSFLLQKSLYFGRLQLPSPPSGTQKILLTPVGKNFFSIAPLSVALLLFSLLFCSLEMLQDLGFDHLPILITVFLSLLFCPNVSVLSIFRKLVGMTLPFTSTLTILLQKNTPLFHLPLLLLLLPLALNVAKFSISFGSVKCQPHAWWSPKVEEAVGKRCRLLLPLIEVMKIVRLTSLLPNMPNISFPNILPSLRHGRQRAHLS